MKRLSRLAISAGIVITGIAVSTAPVDARPSENSVDYISASWGDAKFVAKRFGWFVRVRVTTDEYEGEASCVYAKVQLDVASGPDPKNDHVAEECNINETTTQTVWLRPDLGTEIRQLKISLCQPDFASDSCESETMPVNPNRYERPDLIDRANDRMLESMRAFQRHKRNETGPFDWNDNGCSGPALRKAEFNSACERHDFGYRNYGHGLTIHPADSTRAWVDQQFLIDMNRICERKYNGDAESDCRNAARINHAGVRVGGARAFFGQA